jgi:DNA ligase-associated metallophosphoesterase
MTRSFSFCGHIFEVAGEAALYWPAHRALLVADLHLEKASAFAATGQLLPPYDSIDTLTEIERLAEQYDAEAVYCLGDNFHDSGGERRLSGMAAARLKAMTLRYDWVWITGNHDPSLSAKWGGKCVDEIELSGVLLRHEAEPDETTPEISGHFHPKFRQQLRGRMVSRRCFVTSNRKIIMPALGALTGGLDVDDPAIAKACGLQDGDQIMALVPTRSGLTRFNFGGSVSFAK